MQKAITLSLLLILISPSMALAQNAEERLDQIERRLERIETMLLGANKEPSSTSSASGSQSEIIKIAVTNKRFDDGVYEDSIWWDAQYTATGLTKAARAVKGTLIFADLFKEPRFRVGVTVDDPIQPNGTVVTNGIGIDYNQFIDSHKWLRSTSLSDMTIWFEVESVLYQDGTSETFE